MFSCALLAISALPITFDYLIILLNYMHNSDTLIYNEVYIKVSKLIHNLLELKTILFIFHKTSTQHFWIRVNSVKIYRMQLKGADKLWAWVPHTETWKKCPYQPVSRNIWFVSYGWKITFITNAQNVLHEIQRMPWHVSSWTATSIQSCWVDADSLTNNHNTMEKCLFLVNRSCIHKGF
jgi:hypothetical protein